MSKDTVTFQDKKFLGKDGNQELSFLLKIRSAKSVSKPDKRIITDSRSIRPSVKVFKNRFLNTSQMFQDMFISVLENDGTAL